MKTAFLGIGTNIGERKTNLDNSIASLGRLPSTIVTAVSNVYETVPQGYSDQPDFLNVCVKISTELSPSGLLGACLGIEAAFGRKRPFKNSPRILDIDLLLYEGVKSDTDELILPHPRMCDREFVLKPLSDILPSLIFDGYDFNTALKRVEGQGIKLFL